MIPNYDPEAAFNALPAFYFEQEVKEHSQSCPACGEKHGLTIKKVYDFNGLDRQNCVILINCPMCKSYSVIKLEEEEKECP